MKNLLANEIEYLICFDFQRNIGRSMPARRGLLAPQNTFLDTIATRFDGTRKYKNE